MSKIGPCPICGETRKLEKSGKQCHRCEYQGKKNRRAGSLVPEPDRECSRCHVSKPADAFHRVGPRQRRAQCNECRAATRGSRRGEEQRARKSKRRRRYTLSGYGITAEQYGAMAAQQRGGCAICGKAPDGKPLHIDHCHQSGRVRALLCSPCNLALGRFEIASTRFAPYLTQYGNGNPLLGYEPAR